MAPQAPLRMAPQAPADMPTQAPVNMVKQAPVYRSSQAPVHMPPQAPVYMTPQAPLHMAPQAPLCMAPQAPVNVVKQAPVIRPKEPLLNCQLEAIRMLHEQARDALVDQFRRQGYWDENNQKWMQYDGNYLQGMYEYESEQFRLFANSAINYTLDPYDLSKGWWLMKSPTMYRGRGVAVHESMLPSETVRYELWVHQQKRPPMLFSAECMPCPPRFFH
jgi:hypothetical protein